MPNLSHLTYALHVRKRPNLWALSGTCTHTLTHTPSQTWLSILLFRSFALYFIFRPRFHTLFCYIWLRTSHLCAFKCIAIFLLCFCWVWFVRNCTQYFRAKPCRNSSCINWTDVNNIAFDSKMNSITRISAKCLWGQFSRAHTPICRQGCRMPENVQWKRSKQTKCQKSAQLIGAHSEHWSTFVLCSIAEFLSLRCISICSMPNRIKLNMFPFEFVQLILCYVCDSSSLGIFGVEPKPQAQNKEMQEKKTHPEFRTLSNAIAALRAAI